MTTELSEVRSRTGCPARPSLFFLLFLAFFLLFALSACLAEGQTALPTLVPTAVPLATTTPPASTLPPPPAVIESSTAVPATNTPVINLAAATALPPSPTVVETAVPTNTSDLDLTLPLITTASAPVTHTLGYSVQGRPIVNYSFGSGPTQVIFVGGIHGGYEWNTILLAYEIIDYYIANPQLVPNSLTLHIIPSANPDGQYLVTNQTGRFQASDVAGDTVPGRFNANNVDLNRNWDCEWSAAATWRDVAISGGTWPFSEPENIALRNFILPKEPAVVVFWHSAANGVFAAGCPGTHGPSLALANIYGAAANYPVYEKFTSYAITGDASDWLTLQGIPSISIELQNHQSLDANQNLNGVQAILDTLSKP